MNDRWQLRVTDNKGFFYEATDLVGLAEIGRQQNLQERFPSHFQVEKRWRIVIAPLDEIDVSRHHLDVRPIAKGRVLLINTSLKQVIGVSNAEPLTPGTRCDVTLPTVLQLGNKKVTLQLSQEDAQFESLPMATIAPGASAALLSCIQTRLARPEVSGMQDEQMVSWVKAFLGLLHSAAGSDDFYTEAARALVDLVKLDSGEVLLRTAEKWTRIARYPGASIHAGTQWQPSGRVLAHVLQEKKTFWQVPRDGVSITDIDAVVASPILNHEGAVIGALYGDRRLNPSSLASRAISHLDAMLVEVLASGVAAGLARVEQEQAASRARIQMEQYMTPHLASKLIGKPELLVGREAMVSILICDIRGFSRISEKIGPAKTVEWMSDVMEELTQCVLAQEGVLVDYAGDELMAMWGAPEDQPDHAHRACRTAQAILASLPRLNERWQAIAQEPLQLGVGVNSGLAQVGNIGSRVKFKYGAQGNSVNMASRVQGATKHLKTTLLITEATQALLDDSFPVRRLCQAGVVNIAQPATLFELVGSISDGWIGLKLTYEHALEEFTRGEFRQACRILGRLILDHPEDGPALILLSRAVACLVEKPENFNAVMVLPGK